MSRLDDALNALRASRPFVELEANLANSGMGKPGQGEAPKVLAMIDAALAESWPMPDEPTPLPPDYWETAQ